MRLDEYPDVGRVRDVAEVLNVSKQTVYAAIKAGKIEAVKVSENTIRVTRPALFDFLNLDSDDVQDEDGDKKEPAAPGIGGRL